MHRANSERRREDNEEHRNEYENYAEEERTGKRLHVAEAREIAIEVSDWESSLEHARPKSWHLIIDIVSCYA